MRRRKYQITDRMEKKVWEVIQEGAALKTKFLARKAAGLRTGEREFESEEAAKKELDRLCAEREDQGWILLESADDTKKKSVSMQEGADLFAAIAKAPDVVDAYLVYGDWLTEQGDPRGELIAVGAQLLTKPKSRTLRGRQEEIVEANTDLLLGELGSMDGVDATWRLGFLDAVSFGVGDEPCSAEPVDVLEMLFRLGTARLLRELVLGDFGNEEDFDYGEEADYEPIIKALVELPLASVPLRRFEILPRRVRLDVAVLGDVSSLYAHVPQLEELAMRGIEVELGEINLPMLRSFQLKTRNPSSSVVTAMRKARWPKLEKIHIDFGKRAGEIVSKEIDTMLESLPSGVRSIGLTGMTFMDDVVANVLSSRVLPQLRRIDLSRGDLTAVGARWLIDNRKKLEGIKLDLSSQTMSRAIVDELRAVFTDWIKIDDGVDGTPRPRNERDDDDYYEGTPE